MKVADVLGVADRGPRLTSEEFLRGVAAKYAQDGVAFAREFHSLAAATNPQTRPRSTQEKLANRELEDHEALPAIVVMVAHELAMKEGDSELADEVLRLGLTMMALWPSYLAFQRRGHPDFVLRRP